MRITQRHVFLSMQIMIIITLSILTIYQVAAGSPLISSVLNALGVAIATVLLYAYLRGWQYSQHATVLASILLSGFVPPPPVFSLGTVLSLFIPPATALILGSPLWVPISAIATFGIFAFRAGPQGIASDPPFYVIGLLVIAGMTLARIITDTALAEAHHNEQRAEQALAQSEEQAHHLAAANQQMEQQLEEQHQLLNLVATLETPVSPLAEGVLFAPIVGHLDSRRTQALTGRLLEAVNRWRGKVIIIDIAGVGIVDTAVARGLLQAAQALRLLGCEVILSGISAEVAMTLTQLNIGLEGLATVRNPQDALAHYLEPELRSIHG